MVIKSSRYFLFGILFVAGILFSLNFVVADFSNCWEENSLNGGTKDSCNTAGCLWASSNSSDPVINIYDPWCGEGEYCCFPDDCMQFDGNSTACDAGVTILNNTINCSWDSYMTMWLPNGTITYGGCMMDWMNSNETFDMGDGCWQYDGDKTSCGANNCNWKPNDANQNTWCGIKSLTDAQMKNSLATSDDIGCCEQTGCWSYDNNETLCQSQFDGMCFYENSSYGGGWCMSRMCSEAADNETKCTTLKNELYMPCEWNGTVCNDMAGGGFIAYDDTDSCFAAGGWYSTSGECMMPSGDDFGAGDGGFLFGGQATCWFADNQENVCGNLTGCAYCVSGTGPNGIDNSTNNICYNKQVNLCEGHDTHDSNSYSNANNSASLVCADVGIKSACNYGPLPNCKWTNSSTNVGAYCIAGTSSEKKAEPPVPFCEHPDSKNNYTMCMQLSSDYMMPCKWDNSSYPVKNCTFNGNAVFGESGEKNFDEIGSDSSCTAAGGTWHTEYYVDGAILKQDSWCEMTGFYDVDNGGAEGNKGNCDTSCWACEFQSDGSMWGDIGAAEASCVGSALGYCRWTNDSGVAFNGFGWCDYPAEMEDAGGADCNTGCGGCDFMINPQAACQNSVANAGVGCKWVNDSGNSAGGYCVEKGKKTCDSDCFSCFNDDACYDSALSCAWNDGLCQPQGFDGEICFDGVDNDGDLMIDCGDPDCGFDNFCGGANIGGDCFAQDTEGGCNQTPAFSGMNCSWMTDDWNPSGWCDMPGMNCWKFDNDMAACGVEPGCTNDSSSMGMADNMCDINMTIMNDANCWQYEGNDTACNDDSSCSWKEDQWCIDNPTDTWCAEQIALNNTPGWCDYKPFATCMGLNESGCDSDSTCNWNQDEYSEQGGWCDVACFDWTLNQTQCEAAAGGICEYRNMSQTCQPEMFMMFGVGGDSGKSGCWQYDGNYTACMEKNVTCQYQNDTYANNNITSGPSGWCMNKAEYEHFGDSKGDVIDLAMDSANMNISGPKAELGVPGAVDIMGMGMKVEADSFNFGAGMFNISDSIICNGRFVQAKMMENGSVSAGTLGSGNSSGSFYWYLDTDGNESGGCVAYGNLNDSGYDFRISYVARNTTDGVVETKQMMRCVSGEWSPTNALVTTSKKMSCGEIGGVMVAVSSDDLESFSEFDATANMRVFMTSVGNGSTKQNPADYVGPGYYTPGSIDFKFVDCSDPNTKDPKCKNVQKFGFNVFEECMNGVDDDENGLIDCLDPMCLFTPKCAGDSAFNFDADSSDKIAPTIIYSEVEELSDAAFVRVDTTEPSSLNLTFYMNDSDCAVINDTIEDIGTGYQDNAKYKPFHDVDLIDYSLENGTTYYYKTKTCDPSGNCAVSACSNFTTKKVQQEKEFIFKIDLPENFTIDIPALNKTNYNFTESFNISGNMTSFDVGIKTNTSVTKNMNMTVHCGDMAIGFFGMNVLGPTKIDLTNGFVCDESEDMMGMNSSLKKWNKLIDEMHLGGAADYIELTLPVPYSASNTLDWSDEEGENASDVTDYVNCSDGGSSNTVCKVPVSMGFSAYSITTPTAAVVDDGGSSGGSSSGGASTVAANTTTNDTANETVDDVISDTPVEEGVVDEIVDSPGVIVDFAKSIGWKSIVSILISLAMIGGVVWYSLKDKREKFIEIKTKTKEKVKK